MKRSEINAIVARGLELVDASGFHLPPYARWTLDDWRALGDEIAEFRDTGLGWDVSDFGAGDFEGLGLLIFTLRNGALGDDRYPKSYAEKLLIQGEDQVLPFHFHWLKREDIINRGGGNLIVEIAASGPDREILPSRTTVTVDGRPRSVARGSTIRLEPGQSITIAPLQYHRFWGERGHGPVLLGEVSMVNDDRTDNHFPEFGDRLPDIAEDEPPRFLLFSDYARLERFRD